MGAKVESRSHNKLAGIESRVQDAIDAFTERDAISSHDVGMNWSNNPPKVITCIHLSIVFTIIM